MGELIGLAAVVLIFGIPLLAIWTSHQQKIAKMQVESTAETTAEKAAQYATQIQRLEDRVQVLERIVTDRGYDVATQIEALRDSRSVEDRDSGMPLTSGSRERV
ncbi:MULTISPECIES: hypothetical protein [Citromicrobium]|uniref:hypothetical protein n=1 Tax=Citromicrobium TaxID=72173 RepID=UPI0001DD0A90|nr:MULTISPECIES: hypothetical protein [Citromicrobium]ALG61356.1 hypothetical protein WG74_11330 [Citromicrobium sp. JL477]KPM12245.1 hypothetical protein VO58_15145 [Citromicrobium sp. JL1351]KPM13021.1 hypothetical protein VM77_14720 [Citromicrobium sp. JL31]KPM20773.1 hypothetical protein VO57_15455 [Citromicrobium sp. JL2201]